jgi:hypothetical protein
LIAAANAGIDVPAKAVEDALGYYKSCQSSDGGFGYTAPGGSNLARTAIGSLCFSLAGKGKGRVYKKTVHICRLIQRIKDIVVTIFIICTTELRHFFVCRIRIYGECGIRGIFIL